MATGKIFEHIDSLDEARTVSGLVARLRPVLNELAYLAVVGDGSVLEATEEWRAQYTRHLLEEIDKAPPPAPRGSHLEANKAGANKAGASKAGASKAGPSKAGANKAGANKAGASKASANKAGAKTKHRHAPREEKTTPSTFEDIPRSLRSIFKGTHPSLRD